MVHHGLLWRGRYCYISAALFQVSEALYSGWCLGVKTLWLAWTACGCHCMCLVSPPVPMAYTAPLLVSEMACDTHLSKANLLVPLCQLKQLSVYYWRPTQYLWTFKGVFFLVFSCTNLTIVSNTQSLNPQCHLLKHSEFILFLDVQTAAIHF